MIAKLFKLMLGDKTNTAVISTKIMPIIDLH